jgi:hypothetical protein
MNPLVGGLPRLCRHAAAGLILVNLVHQARLAFSTAACHNLNGAALIRREVRKSAEVDVLAWPEVANMRKTLSGRVGAGCLVS